MQLKCIIIKRLVKKEKKRKKDQQKRVSAGDDPTHVTVKGTTEAGGWYYWNLSENINLSVPTVWSGRQSVGKTTGMKPKGQREKEEKAELLIVWVLKRNMSDVLLSMKLSCKSLSAPVVHTDKASFTKTDEKLHRQEEGKYFTFSAVQKMSVQNRVQSGGTNQ